MATAACQEMMFLFTDGGAVIFAEYVNSDMSNYGLHFSVKLLQNFFMKL